MTRGARPRLCAALALLAAVFVTEHASAQCPSGSYSCGADYCTPDGDVCCASVGLPQYYCSSGTTCLSDGSCQSGTSSANVSSSSSSSGTSGGSGGGCPSGSYSCGADYCTPDGDVCCASVGLPQYYCPSGTTCLNDGSCQSGTSSDGSSSSAGSSDTSSGTSGSNTGSGSSSGTTGSPAPEIDGCASYYDLGYDEYQVQAQCQSAYVYACAGYQAGINASCDILEAWGYGARDKCPYCNGTDPRQSAGASSSGSSSASSSSSSGGCALSRGSSPASQTLFALALLGAGSVLRRRGGRRR